MKAEKLLVILITLTVLSTAAASQQGMTPEGLKESFSFEKSNFIVDWLAGDQRIELEIEINSTESIMAGIQTDGINITDVNRQGFERPTISLRTNATTYERITSSESPIKELDNQIGTGVELKANGLFNKLRLALIRLVLKLAA